MSAFAVLAEVSDRPGILSGLTRVLADHQANITYVDIHDAGEPTSDIYFEFTMDRDEVVRVLNGRYYRLSNTQFWENVDHMTRGFPFFFLQIKVKDYRVSPTDGHMNAAAIDQVCADLAGPVAALLPRARSGP